MKRLFAAVLSLAAAPAAADVALPPLFSDHAVLQRGPRTRVWGTADPGERVTVAIAGRTATAQTGADGRWEVAIGPLDAGGPHVLTVTGTNALRSQDVLVGDVWLASGQSNMEFPLARAKDGAAETKAADFARIRELGVAKATAREPQAQARGGWAVCTPANAASFSAVAYFFARELHASLGVPIGIVHASWGGTPAEAWTSRETLAAHPRLRPLVEASDRTLADPAAAAAYERALAGWEAKNVVADAGDEGVARGWARSDFDDSAWQTMALPAPWERAGLAIDGAVWFRRTVEVPPAWAGRDLVVALGAIDDFDTTYWDGIPVGATGRETPEFWAHARRYVVPARLVRAGRAVLAVRAFDRGGDGGFFGPAATMEVGPAGAAPQRLAGDWRYAVERALGPVLPDWGSLPRSPFGEHAPAALYNAMIAPYAPATLRGAIWYQGEENVARADEYRELLPALIADWRRAFDRPDLPFLFVQLASFHPRAAEPGESEWAELREAQRKTLAVPHTGMAVAIDVGDADDIHPSDKQTVGHRLALLALDRVYGRRGRDASGPLFRDARADGASFRVRFDHAEGLRAQDGGAIAGFAIAGADRRFVWAEARVEGAEVVVSSPRVPAPAAVRYGWADNPRATLVNGAGLPASPFRTDDWPGLTAAR